ncbi:probable disease resistance protein At4g27220 isoform X2 [Gossypium hirsutum]|uniref:Probable disease resistance protein At4g27220 isoform X2 n=1 Tax=Gossypium hirsutum TaxID=3635 RepID=A0ABM3BI33_GOSHI|nr:probable disease resistance protein At4g27220 isoform X2 [Gossypium hirsutum]
MAESVASAAVENMTNQAMECASPYLRYFFCYGQIVQDFTNQRNALKLRKQRVDTRVDEAKRQIEVIYEDVEDWLKRAEKELEQTQNLQDEIDRVKCFKWCPQWGWRYCLRIEFITSTHFMDSKSSKSALNQIMEAMKAVNMIGLYGMPGVGKTTLAQEVGKHAGERKLFDKVVMFTMSQNPNINSIQDKVADVFGLKFQTSSREGRAEELFKSMQRVNKILVIVDDLWEEFELKIIGIPFGDDHKGCKILLTTRRQQVCTKMNCQKEIQLGILSEDEAWVLFRDQAGLEGNSSALNNEAKKVAAQCKGLPLAIVVVAKAVKGEGLDLNGWKAVNQRFKDSRHLDNEDFGDVLQPLKLSYDYLKKGNNQMTENDIQICFLLCSLFPEDTEIPIEILIMCGIGVGLFPNANSIEDKRNEMVMALKKLQKSGLLLGTDDAKRIRMHDVVRDFAHWLTSTGENRFMVKDKLKKWPDMVESFECYTAIALWNCSSNIKFPDKVEFSKLKTLFLKGEWKWRRDDFLVVSSTFFEEMKALQVLFLQHVSFSAKRFPSLPNLKTLCCVRCELKIFPSSLTNLEILALFETKIFGISEKLVKLPTLKYLRLSGVQFYEESEIKIHPSLLSRLTSLQELHVHSQNTINLLELNSLSCLTALSLRLSTDQFSQEDFVFPKLQMYTIVVNEHFSYESALRTLKICNFPSSFSAFNNLFYNVEKLKLQNVRGQKNIVPSIGEMGVNELTSLELESCYDMEFLTVITRDQGPSVAFSNLVELYIQSMGSLKGLCYGHSPTRFLQNLKQVIIKKCEQLQVIFQIDELSEKVQCQIPLLSNLTILNLDSLPNLESIWKLNPSHQEIVSLTRLKVVTISGCDKLKTIFTTCQALSMLHLQELTIRYCDKVEQVIGFVQEEEIIENDCPFCCWPKLEILRIKFCQWLKYVYVNTSTLGRQSLKSVSIESCPEFIQFFNMEQNKYGQHILHRGLGSQESFVNLTHLELTSIALLNFKYLFSEFTARTLEHLKFLMIRDCSFLEHLIEEVEKVDEIYVSNMKNHYPLFWPKLESVHIEYCENLKYLCSSTLAQRLPNLNCISILDCPRLIQVFNMETNKDDFELQNHCWPKLETLDIVNCQILKYVLPNTLLNVPFLQYLTVINCPQFSCFIVQAPLIKELVLRDVGNSHQLCNIDVHVLNKDCIVVGNHEEVFQVQGGYSFSSIKELYLTNLLEVRIIWNDFAQVVTLNNLTSLKVSDCKKLRYIFSPTNARSLSRLMYLCIKGCDELEQIILAKDQVSSSSSNADIGLQPLSFPNLTQIIVTNCGNLKSLFPFGFVPVLPKLESLELKRNSKLEQVFKLENEVEMAGEEETKFDKLERLTLEELPSLIHFCPKGCHFVLPALIELEVKDCPKLTTSFFVDSQKFVHCITKIPQLVKQDAIEETVTDAIFNKNINWSHWGGSQLPHIT